MKNNSNKIKLLLSGLILGIVVFAGSNIASAINYYTYSFPYEVTTTPPPPPAVSVDLSLAVNPVHYPTYNGTTILWNILTDDNGPADSCIGTLGTSTWPAPSAKSPSYGINQEFLGNLTPGVYTFRIDCYKGVAHDWDTIMLVVLDDTVSNNPTATLNANPGTIDSGLSSNLSWTSTNTASCVTGSGPWLNPGARPVNSPAPESTGPLYTSSAYELICTGTNSVQVHAFKTVVVNTPQPPTIIFSAVQNPINSGQTSHLIWTASNATNCSTASGPWLNQGVRPLSQALPGEETAPLTTNTIYGITCSNNVGPTTAYATVYVNRDDDDDPPTISYFSPFSCVGGGSKFGSLPRFTWDTTHANSCTITRTTAPQISENVGISSQASGGVQELNGLYYYLSTLPVLGSSSNYRLQCINGSQVVNEYAAVNTCSPDFTLGASPILRSFIDGREPTTGVMGKIATYTISASPVSGFGSNIALSIQSKPTMPSSTTFTFTPDTLSSSGGSYNTSTLTIWIDPAEFPAPGGSTVYTPIVIQGVGGGFTRTVTVGADATGKKIMKYREPNN